MNCFSEQGVIFNNFRGEDQGRKVHPEVAVIQKQHKASAPVTTHLPLTSPCARQSTQLGQHRNLCDPNRQRLAPKHANEPDSLHPGLCLGGNPLTPPSVWCDRGRRGREGEEVEEESAAGEGGGWREERLGKLVWQCHMYLLGVGACLWIISLWKSQIYENKQGTALFCGIFPTCLRSVKKSLVTVLHWLNSATIHHTHTHTAYTVDWIFQDRI